MYSTTAHLSMEQLRSTGAPLLPTQAVRTKRFDLAMNTPWIAYHRPIPNAQLRLFCFHHAGGAASSFRAWRDQLQPYQIELCPIQLPGRETRAQEPLQTELKSLVQQIGKALTPYLDKPFAFLGHSMGGVLAFYVALYLQERGHRAQRLIISGTTPPRCRQQQRPIHDLPDVDFLAAVNQYNGIPTELLENQEALALLLPILRADFQATANTQGLKSTLLRSPLSVFTGLSDRTVNGEELENWRQHAVGTVKVRKFPGDHFFLYQQPNLVIRAIVQDLFSAAW